MSGVLDRLAHGAFAREGSPVSAGWEMARDAVQLLREIRDHTGEGASESTQYLTRTVGLDIVGGGAIQDVRLPAGVGWRLSSFALSTPGVNGFLTIQINGDLLKVVPITAVPTGSGFYTTGTFGTDDYMPENSSVRLIVENAGTDGHAILTVRGKAFIPGEPVDTSRPNLTLLDGEDYGDNGSPDDGA